MKYLVSTRVLETIERECWRYPQTETGGILVGFRDHDQVTITDATGPGPKSERSAQHFVKDTDYLQSVLNLLFEYFQVNYLGVWHKHPDSMPHPSDGDVVAAMQEVGDPEMDLAELITPICVMSAGKVNIVPYRIKDHLIMPLTWDPVPHQQLPAQRSRADHWYATPVGQRRLTSELAELEAIGVAVELRKGRDGSYRFYAPVADGSPLRLVMLCHDDYPVSAPEVAVYDIESKNSEPVSSPKLSNWNIHQHLVDLFREYQGISVTAASLRQEGSSSG